MEKSFNDRVKEAQQAVSALNPKEAAALREAGDVVFVDPRPIQAIKDTTGIISGARNLLLDDITEGRLPADIDRRSIHVIAACEGGPMGAIAAHELQKQGFSRVSYLEGGTRAWLEAGFSTSL
jgi:rhodanese-related sulfurtransferase